MASRFWASSFFSPFAKSGFDDYNQKEDESVEKHSRNGATGGEFNEQENKKSKNEESGSGFQAKVHCHT
jgi:hypothetical protein